MGAQGAGPSARLRYRQGLGGPSAAGRARTARRGAVRRRRPHGPRCVPGAGRARRQRPAGQRGPHRGRLEESPPEIAAEADLVVEGTEGVLGHPPGAGHGLMLFSELLRITVLLVAGVATALAALSVLVIQNDDSTFAAIFGGGWWLIATVIGLLLGTPARAAEGITPALRGARTATSLPSESDTRIAFMRLWPIGAFAIVCGVAGVCLPADRGDRGRLRAPHRSALAPARGRGAGDRGSGRCSLLRRADLGTGADPSRSHSGPLSGSLAAAEAPASTAGRGSVTRDRAARAKANRAPSAARARRPRPSPVPRVAERAR